MNKKLFLGMFAAAGMLLATSCSNDELDVVQSGNEAQVTFSLAAEGGIATRAISDGKTANKLVYAVFDSEGNPLSVFEVDNDGTYEHQKTETISDIVTTTHEVTITLAKGQTYQVAFWAQNESCTAYKTSDLRNIEVLYGGLNNDETRDAFFKAETFTVTGNTEIDVVLKRPFAQINVGVTEADWNAAVASGVTISESKVVIKNAAKYIDLLTGEVNGEVEVEYGFSAIPTDPAILEVDVDRDGAIQNDEKYKYLSMSYILTSAERTTLESDGLQFTFKSGGNDIVFDEGLHQVPVQRNWRTNILGKLLTGDITFEVVIVPDYEDNYNLWYPESDDNSVFSVTSAEEITNAIKNATSDVTINFANDITGNATAEQKEGVNVVVNGNGYKYDGTITLDGNSRHTGVETLTIANINFEHAVGSLDFIECNVGGGYDAYAHNVTVKDCTFKGNSIGDVVGMRYRQCYNMSVINCTATDVHSLMWTTGGENITVDGVNVTAKEGGLSTSTTKNISVKNSTITVPTAYGYGIRLNSSDDNTNLNLNIENNTITADAPILLRQAKAMTYTIDLTGNNTLLTDKVYHIITTAGEYKDDVALSAPTGMVDINGAENFNVYPAAATATTLNASSDAQLSSVIDAGVSTINLTPGTYIIPDNARGKTLTFTGTKDVVVNVNTGQRTSGSTITFEGVTIQGADVNYRGFHHTNAVSFKNCTIKDLLFLYSTTTFENCIFESTAEHCVWTYGSKDVKFKDCKFSYSDRCVNVYIDNGTEDAEVVFENCVFTPTASSSKGAVEINSSVFPNGVKVDFTACVSPAYGEMVFISGWDSTNGATAAVTIDGSTVTVPQLAK